MRYLAGFIIVILAFSWSCSTTSKTSDINLSDAEKEIYNSKKADTVRIANDSIEYEIIVIEPGFYTFINSIARPRGYYSQPFLESRNIILTINYNQRVINPARFDPQLYQQIIDYRAGIDYGYEVNYLLYNYYIFFQRRFNQKLSGFIPRI